MMVAFDRIWKCSLVKANDDAKPILLHGWLF